MPNSPSYLLATPPKAPDPAEAARVFGELTANAGDAALASMRAFSRAGDPLPYDPAPIAQAFSTLAMNLASHPTRLIEAQAEASDLRVTRLSLTRAGRDRMDRFERRLLRVLKELIGEADETRILGALGELYGEMKHSREERFADGIGNGGPDGR